MNFADLQQSEITLYGPGNNNVQMKFPVPPELKYNLRTKRVGIQDLEIDVSSFPRFVPELAVWDPNVQSFTAGSTSDSFTGNGQGTAGAGKQLGYYFVIRKNDNSKACTSFVTWSNPNNINGSQYDFGNIDRRTTYLTPYYYCYNFMDFLSMCQQALVDGLTNVLGGAPASVPTFLYYADSKTFKLTIPVSIGGTWNIEMSQSLKDLFNFQTATINLGYKIGAPQYIIPTYQILWATVDTAESDFGSTCNINNTIYPFDLYFLECTSLPINRISFISTRTQVYSGADLQSRVLKRWRKHYNAVDREQILVVDTVEEVDKLRPMSDDNIQDDLLTFVVWVRTRREQEYIEWRMPLNHQIKFLLNTYSLV